MTKILKRATGVEPVTFGLEELARPQTSHGEPQDISGFASAATVDNDTINGTLVWTAKP